MADTGRHGKVIAVNSNKMFLSLVPWLVFSVLVHRLGADAAWLAALAAAGLGAVFLVRDAGSGVKLIDVVGVGTFGLYALAGIVGGLPVSAWVADYGRGTAALLLGAIMLASVAVVPFSEQYARESVAREYWATPAFRAVNRKISALWGSILLVMGIGHLIAGALDPLSVYTPGPRPTDFLLNWAVPAGLILFGVSTTRQLAGTPSDPTPAEAGDQTRAGR
jgi:hypothetical protein